MGDEAGALEQISFLTRSNHRIRILTGLLTAGSLTRREFRERLDASRSTVTRTLSALEERDLVVRTGDEYRLTPSGTIIADAVDDLVATVELTDELSTFIEWFPYSEYDIALEHFREAEITASTDPDPYAPSRKHAAAIRVASSYRMMLSSIDLQLVRSVGDNVEAGELELELLVPPSMEETISTGEFASTLGSQIEAGGMTVYVTDKPVPFYLGLSGDRDVQIGVEDDEGFPRALLETGHEPLCEWAEGVYAEYRETAREKPRSEF